MCSISDLPNFYKDNVYLLKDMSSYDIYKKLNIEFKIDSFVIRNENEAVIHELNYSDRLRKSPVLLTSLEKDVPLNDTKVSLVTLENGNVLQFGKIGVSYYKSKTEYLVQTNKNYIADNIDINFVSLYFY